VNLSGRTVAVWVATCMALLAPVTQLWAQKSGKPAVIVSIAKPDKLLGDIGYLTRAAGTPEFGGLVTLMAGPYLQGIDSKRPAGVYLQFNGPQPTGTAFVPVSDLDQIVKQLENNSIEVEDAGGGIKKVQLQRPIYFVEKSGWAFISDSDSNLKNLPADPTANLNGLHDKYDLAIQLNVRNIDPSLIDMAVSEMKSGFERSLEAETDEKKKELQEKVGRQQLENFSRLFQESDQITVGWGVDSGAGKTFLDFSMTAVAGSKLAQQMAAYQKMTSNFGGFELDDAAATLRFTTPIAKEDIGQAREALTAMRDQALAAIDKDDNLDNDDAKKTAKQVVNSLVDILVATIEAGKIDGGAALYLEPESIQVVVGGFVADGRAVKTQLEKLVNLAKQAGGDDVAIEDLKFNAAKHKDVDLHTFSVPIPGDEEQAQKVFGDALEVVVGTGAKSAFLAFGEESIDLLKEIIDDSAASAKEEVTPMEFIVSLTPILEFAASIEDDQVVKMLLETIKKAPGKDHIRMSQSNIDRGVTARLEVEEGVLQLIGAAAKARSGNTN
jgi:hypothetical protein